MILIFRTPCGYARQKSVQMSAVAVYITSQGFEYHKNFKVFQVQLGRSRSMPLVTVLSVCVYTLTGISAFLNALVILALHSPGSLCVCWTSQSRGPCKTST